MDGGPVGRGDGSPADQAWAVFLRATGMSTDAAIAWIRDDAADDASANTLVHLVGPTPVPANSVDDTVEVEDRSPLVLSGGRYKDLGSIGTGGMGEVRRVLDHRLNRKVAMKVLKRGVRSVRTLHRFIEEAQTSAQLQHPGIVPTYELGELDDGRPFFTMKEVQGTTLEELILATHTTPGTPGPDGRPWSVPRLVDAFHRACEAVAFAHARRVLHRDLKPSNIMVGGFGEVVVMDWGLAKVMVDDVEVEERSEHAEGVVTDRSRVGTLATRHGAIVGTPAYMAPEQAEGGAGVSFQTDVFALGAILFEILLGRRAYPQGTLESLLDAKLCGPHPIADLDVFTVPEELRAVCARAMHQEREQRYANAGELAEDVGRWLDGEKRRERARLVVEEARALEPEISELLADANSLTERAEKLLQGVQSYASVDEKREAWSLQDQASALAQEVVVRTELYVQTLRTALNHDPELEEAHELLASHFRERHMDAERSGDTLGASQYETSLRFHDRGSHAAYLRGDGALSLVTSPPGATVDLYEFNENDRRLVPKFARRLGRTPLRKVELERGSHLLRIRKPGFETALYPVHIERGQHWDGIRPGAREPYAVELPAVGELGPDDVYVPAGWAVVGGDAEAIGSLSRRRVWVDAFVCRRFPVTNAEYLAYLNALVDAGNEAAALLAAPRERAGAAASAGTMIYARDTHGHFFLRPDVDGDVWRPDWPVVMVDWLAAQAHAQWMAEQTGRGWRLPSELEREKAARSVDGRLFPWGRFLDPTFCCMRESHAGRWLPASVSAFPADESVYGVRGLSGNVGDWCLDDYRAEGHTLDGEVVRVEDLNLADTSPRIHRGGRWSGMARGARSATRMSSDPRVRTSALGFRLFRSYPG